MQKVTFFDTREELAELTGLSMENHCDELWKAGFNLDDWDFGIQTETEWTGEWDRKHPYYESWLLLRMDCHCVGYEHVEHNGKHYYMVYHS